MAEWECQSSVRARACCVGSVNRLPRAAHARWAIGSVSDALTRQVRRVRLRVSAERWCASVAGSPQG